MSIRASPLASAVRQLRRGSWPRSIWTIRTTSSTVNRLTAGARARSWSRPHAPAPRPRRSRVTHRSSLDSLSSVPVLASSPVPPRSVESWAWPFPAPRPPCRLRAMTSASIQSVTAVRRCAAGVYKRRCVDRRSSSGPTRCVACSRGSGPMAYADRSSDRVCSWHPPFRWAALVLTRVPLMVGPCAAAGDPTSRPVYRSARRRSVSAATAPAFGCNTCYRFTLRPDSTDRLAA